MAEIVTCPSCGRRNRVPAAATGVARCANCHTPLPWLTSAGDGDFEQVVTASSLPVLLDLWAPWCGPCREVARQVGAVPPPTPLRWAEEAITNPAASSSTIPP
jgi:thiol-disulfide isomerase/thioredoxin